MITPKLKQCSACGKSCVLWKSNPPLCRICADKERYLLKQTTNGKVAKPFKPIKKVSDKQAKKNAAYSVMKKQFIKDNPRCQVGFQNCTLIATDIHHVYSGASRSKYFLDTREWKATCRNCHTVIHDYLPMHEAIALGLKKIE